MKQTLLATHRTSRRWLVSSPILLAISFGVFATTLAEEPKNEIKLFVADAKIDDATKRVQEEFPTGTPPPKKHQIYFFDTKSLELYGNTSGPVILRARQKEGKKPQSTVKFRRDKRDPNLEKKLADISSELEIETESVAGKKGPPGISYALDAKPGKELSELDGAGSDKIEGWFSADQKKFLKAAGVKVDWKGLKVFGRIEADVWEWQEQDKRVDAEVTAELWRLGTRRIFELSCKKPGGNAAKQLDSFVAFFKDHHILAVENPDSKTKQALDHFGSIKTHSPQPVATATPAGP